MAGRAVEQVWLGAVLTISSSKKAGDTKETIYALLASDKIAVGADRDGHDSEVTGFNGNLIFIARSTLAGQTGMRFLSLPAITEGCAPHHGEKPVIRHGMGGSRDGS